MFAKPYFLFALVLLVPVVIAFLFRRRDRMASVPSTLLFRRVAISRLKNKKLKTLMRRLAVLMCLAGVAALALAAADPHVPSSSADLALVVDVSASMEGAPHDDSLGTVRRMLRARPGDQRVALIAAGAEPRHLVGPTTDAEELDDALDELTLERGEADLAAALSLADALMHGRAARIVVISDGGAASVEDRRETSAPVSFLRVADARENVGISVLAVRQPLDARHDEEREVTVTVAASGTERRRVRIVLSADEVELGREELELNRGRDADATFRLRVAARRVNARLEVLDDHDNDMEVDDHAALDLGSASSPIVHLIASADSRSRFFVERAIRATGAREIRIHAPNEAPRELADGEIAVVLETAPEHAVMGPTLYLASERGDLPVTLGARLSSEGGRTQLLSIDTRHALTRSVDLDGSTISTARALSPAPDMEVPIELDGGPVAAVGGAGRLRWAYIGIDPSSSDLVLRVAFPVLIANSVAMLHGASDVRVADTLPRSEIALRETVLLEGAHRVREPWPIPSSPAVMLSLLAALVLLAEGFAFFRGWSR